MSADEASRAELVAKLAQLLDASRAEKREHDRLVLDLQTHQIELELQNRELREVQSALEASRSRFEELYDFAPIAYFTFDAHGCVVEVNLTGATLIGRDRAQLIGAPFLSLIEVAEPPRFWSHLRRCTDTGAPVVSELAVSSAHAGAMHVRAISVPMHDPAGRAVAFRTAFIDITDRHHAELARDQALEAERTLRRELELLDDAKTVLARALATVSEESLGAVLQIVVEQARSIADAEFAALGIGGAPGEPFSSWVHAGMTADQVAALGHAPRVVGVLGAVFREARTIRTADLRTHPSFRGFPVAHPAMTSFLGVPVWFGPRVVGILYLTNKRGHDDFSSNDQDCIESLGRYVGIAMEIARLGDEARAAIRVRDHLLAIVSHDLRSPLSTIAISASLLLRAPADDPEIGRRQAGTIKLAADRMSRLINDLLTATTIEAGHLTAERRRERVDRLVADAVEVLEPVVTARALTLEASVPAELPDVLCDRDRIQQVLANLVGNAVKVTPEGGRIRIEAERHGDEMRISVTDTGPGIPDHDREHLFDRYWRGDAAGRPGVGLGLYISRGIVATHGGRIWVDAVADSGARFTFTLPLAGRAAGS